MARTSKAKAAKPAKSNNRYSDEELAEFRTIINEKLAKSRSELSYLHEQIARKGSFSADSSESRFRGLEDGAGTLEREQLNQHAARQIKYISHLENALSRLENGTYGICRKTGKLISKERLRMVPHATLSIAAKKAQQ